MRKSWDDRLWGSLEGCPDPLPFCVRFEFYTDEQSLASSPGCQLQLLWPSGLQAHASLQLRPSPPATLSWCPAASEGVRGRDPLAPMALTFQEAPLHVAQRGGAGKGLQACNGHGGRVPSGHARSSSSLLPRWRALCSQTPRHRLVSAAERSPRPGSAVKPGRVDFLLATLAQGSRGTAKPPSTAPVREGRACRVGRRCRLLTATPLPGDDDQALRPCRLLWHQTL